MKIDKKNRTPRKTKPAEGDVWQARVNDQVVAILVTERGDVNAYVAAIPVKCDAAGVPLDDALAQAIEIADVIAVNPKYAETTPGVADLRGVGRLDSLNPVPAEMFTWHCGPAFGSSSQGSRRLTPFCRFRLIGMLARLIGAEPKHRDKLLVRVHIAVESDRDDISETLPAVLDVPVSPLFERLSSLALGANAIPWRTVVEANVRGSELGMRAAP